MALTYKKAGVDIAKGNRLIDIIRPDVRSTFRPGVLTDIGSFSASFRIRPSKYKDPVLMSSTDGVGTKLKIAFMLDRHSTVGIDLVAMCVNDILTAGAEPLFFLDYLATGRLSTGRAADIIRGIARGCKTAGCALIGGETAEMPGFYKTGEYDLAGFCVGMVDRNRVVAGSGIRSGDAVIGIASNGLHSNGYSLARKLFFGMKKYRPGKKIQGLELSLGEELLRPTKIYVKSVLKILKRFRIKGMAHVTGGGITENLPRVLPEKSGLRAVITKKSWPVPEIFNIMRTLGKIPRAEMFRTFNMGVGYIMIAGDRNASAIVRQLNSAGEKAYIIGEIEKGKKGVKYV